MPENTLAVVATAAGQGVGISVASLEVYYFLHLVLPSLSPRPEWQVACKAGQALFSGSCDQSAHHFCEAYYYDRYFPSSGGDFGKARAQPEAIELHKRINFTELWEAVEEQVNLNLPASLGGIFSAGFLSG